MRGEVNSATTSSLSIMMTTMATIATCWDFVYVPADSVVDVFASFRWDFDGICELRNWAKFSESEDASGVFNLALENLNPIMARDTEVPAKDVASERVHVTEESPAALLTGWSLEKIEMVCKHHEACTTVRHFNIDLTAAFEQVFGQVNCEI